MEKYSPEKGGIKITVCNRPESYPGTDRCLSSHWKVNADFHGMIARYFDEEERYMEDYRSALEAFALAILMLVSATAWLPGMLDSPDSTNRATGRAA